MRQVTIEELELATVIVAHGMKYHNMLEALPVLERFDAELNRRRAAGNAMDYADRVLERYTVPVAANDNRPVRLARAA